MSESTFQAYFAALSSPEITFPIRDPGSSSSFAASREGKETFSAGRYSSAL